MKLIHPIKPLYDENSKILILGSFPSVKSREGMFFYNHPQNRFWQVVSTVCNQPLPITIEQKKEMILKCNIALWDVIHSCEIENSSDSSIKNVTVNDFNKIISSSKITKIFTNGNKAFELYCKYCETDTGIKAVPLPSTSPANASFNLERLCDRWKEIKKFL